MTTPLPENYWMSGALPESDIMAIEERVDGLIARMIAEEELRLMSWFSIIDKTKPLLITGIS